VVAGTETVSINITITAEVSILAVTAEEEHFYRTESGCQPSETVDPGKHGSLRLWMILERKKIS